MKHQPVDYGPGFFTSLMRENRWPPGFQSQLDPNPGEVKKREAAVRGRATQLANGHTGSIRNGLSRKSASVQLSVESARVAHLVITREEAAEQGLTRYFTGEPCIAEHLAQRYVSTHGCVECMNANARARYAAEKKAVRA